MKKIYLVIGLAILIIGGCLIFTRTPKEADSDPISVRIGYNTESLTNVSIIIAYEGGYFQKYGLSPQMIPLKSGREVMQALAAGQVDIGIGGFPNFMQAMVKNAPLRFIAASASSPSYVFVRPNEDLNKLTDLYGKIISVSTSGVNDLVFRTVMDKEKIDTEKMEFADIERSYLIAALMNKKAVDATVVSEQDTDMLLKAGAILLPEWVEKGYDQETVPRNSIIANSEFLNQQETAAENFLNALIDAHRLIKEEPEEAARLLAEHIEAGSGGAIVHVPANIVKQWEDGKIINMIWQNPEVTMKLVRKAKEIGVIDRELSLEEVFDLRFADKLKAAQAEIYGIAD
jgi:ABC-type nitrate/sulfonate/bicarbonate transport system substrate-binding protein